MFFSAQAPSIPSQAPSAAPAPALALASPPAPLPAPPTIDHTPAPVRLMPLHPASQ